MDQDSTPKWGKAALKLFGVGTTTQPVRRLAAPENLTDTKDAGDELPFGLRSHMLSQQSALLYRALVAAMAADAVVFAKVRLADFLFVSGGENLKHAVKMDRKYVDFLLCDPFSMQPLAVIELSFPVETGEKPKSRDPFVSRALKTAGIPLLKIEARQSYPVQQLRGVLLPRVQNKQQEAGLNEDAESSPSGPNATS